MKIVIITHRSEDHGPADFEPYLLPEAKKSFEYMEDDFIRELYSRRDGKGAVVIVEAASEDEARAKCADLPLVKAGLLRCDFYPVKAFRAIKVAADMF
jgi:hypothetical protein